MRAYQIAIGANLRRRWRALLLQTTALWLALGLIGAGALTLGSVQSSLSATVEQLGAPHLWLRFGAPNPQQLYQQIQATPNVAAVTPLYLQLSGWARTPAATIQVAIMPLDEAPALRHFTLEAGRLPAAGEAGLLIERGAAEALGLEEGGPLSLVGPQGPAEVPVRGIVRDLSQASYPLSTPGLIYVSAASWGQLTAGQRLSDALVGVRLADADAGPETSSQLGALLPQGQHSIVAWRWVADGLGPLLSAQAGFMLLFGLGALLATLIFLAGGLSVDILRDARSLAVLRATGWSARQLRMLLALQHLAGLLPGLLLGLLSAYLLARWLTARTVAVLGAAPVLAQPAPTLAGLALGSLMLVLLTCWVMTRRLGRQPPAAGLGGGHRRPPSALARLVQARWLPFPLRVAASLTWSRPLYAALNLLIVSVGLITVVFAVIMSATVADFSANPAAWGYRYDWMVRPARPEDAPAVAAALAQMPGVNVSEPVYIRPAELPGGAHFSAKFVAAEQQLLELRLLQGRVPQGPGEVLLGAGLATGLGVAPGAALRIVVMGQPLDVVVAGTYRELDQLGQMMLGYEPLLRQVEPDAQPSFYLARLDPHVDAAAARSQLEQRTPQAIVVAVQEQIDVPFATTMRRMLLGLGGGLILLAAIMMFNMLLIVTQEQLYAFGVMRAVGADGAALLAIGGYGLLLFLLPCALVALPAGLLLATRLVQLLSAQIGGVTAVVQPAQLALALLAALLAPALGFMAPMLGAVRRSSTSIMQS